MTTDAHRICIIDQFTRQATPFNTAPTITDNRAMGLLLRAAEPNPQDTILDVACGGGVVVCAFAPRVAHATGVDLTPAMLEHARMLAVGQQLTNVSWTRGNVVALPYADHSFSKVLTRFSFHHFVEPLAVLQEMVRVCAPGGRIVIADMYASEDRSKASAWNKLETLRDPSHVRALPLSELLQLFGTAALSVPEVSYYDLQDSVSNLLTRSFPNRGDEKKITELFAQAAVDDHLGIVVTRHEGELYYRYKVAILAAVRPA